MLTHNLVKNWAPKVARDPIPQQYLARIAFMVRRAIILYQLYTLNIWISGRSQSHSLKQPSGSRASILIFGMYWIKHWRTSSRKRERIVLAKHGWRALFNYIISHRITNSIWYVGGRRKLSYAMKLCLLQMVTRITKMKTWMMGMPMMVATLAMLQMKRRIRRRNLFFYCLFLC